jgi:hypothetical protein
MADTDARMVVLEGVARQAKGSQPTAKWRALWREAIAPFSPEEVRAWCRLQWARLETGEVGEATVLASFWGMAPLAVYGTPTLIADWALKLHKGDAQRFGNAAIHALGEIAAEAESPEVADEAIHQLQRLKSRIRHRTTAKRIAQALGAVAKARGLSAEALEDRVVEAGGMSAEGSRAWRAGAHDLYLFLTDDGDAELAIFEQATGRAVGSPPKKLKQDHFGVLQEAKAVQKVVAESLVTQKQRLELALESQREWTRVAWQQVFARNPVMKHLARRLIWSVYDGERPPLTVAYSGEDFTDVDGHPVGLPDLALIRLMHPVLLDEATLRGWQRHVVFKRLIQPFKQAFRETYRLEDADRATAYYSDRFAGVVVRHRQMYALLRSRGWSGLAGIGPAGYTGTKDLPGYGLQALIGFRQFRHYQEPQRRQIVLDQVEFYPIPTPEWAPGREVRARIAESPPVVFSEVMRDLALVVGVARVGYEDELRGDTPMTGRFRSLDGLAATRASMIRELLPHLGLEEQVELEAQEAVITAHGHRFRLDLATGHVHLEGDGRRIDLEGIARTEGPLYLPHEGADTATAAIMATMIWLAQFGRGD